MAGGLDNANPTIHSSSSGGAARKRLARQRAEQAGLDFGQDDLWLSLGEGDESDDLASAGSGDDEQGEEIDSDEIFDLIRSITDPEHPLTLEQLAVVSAPQITVTHGRRPTVLVEFTPTIPHCSMATLIGLSLRVRLLRALPERFKVDIKVKKGSHQSENSVNKQLNDKERVAAALENQHLVDVVQQCLTTASRRGESE